MSVEINFKEHKHVVDTIIWDRDSYFINPNSYWARLAATIAQKTAETTTDNWGNFNLVRTQAIKVLGINPESGLVEPASPINLLPVNIFHSILTPSLTSIIKNKNYNELNTLLREIVEKSLLESKDYIKDSLVKENIELIKSFQNSTKNILITNDSKENNNIFLDASALNNYFTESYTNTNKEQAEHFFKANSLFISSNPFLVNLLKEKKLSSLSVENLRELLFKPTTNTKVIKINIDGASKGNPGPSSIGIVFQNNKETIKEVSEYIGNQTNNFAEYTALIRALEISLECGFHNIEVKSDSELVVKQINKVYKVKDADIKELFDKVNALREKLSSFKITHVPREENLKADKLANQALK